MSLPRVLFVARTRYSLPLSETPRPPLRCPLGGARLAPARHVPRRRSGAHRTVHARADVPRRRARGGYLLRGAALAGAERDPGVRAGGRRRAGGSGHGPGAARPPARRVGRSRRLRRPRRLAQRHSHLRLAPAQAPLTPDRPAGADRRHPGRRRAHGVRVHVVARAEQGVEPTATFPAYMDSPRSSSRRRRSFRPLPEALFVGVLERYKGVDVLASAWTRWRRASPGRASTWSAAGRCRTSSSSSWQAAGVACGDAELATDGVAGALDATTALVLPSRREGMGRVIVEAFCRGARSSAPLRAGSSISRVRREWAARPRRGRRGARGALTRMLAEPATATRLGEGARTAASAWAATPEEFATRMRSSSIACWGGPDRMRLIFVTQRVDPDDPVLGATVAKLARHERCDELVVLTDSAIPGALPANCRVRLFASRSRPGAEPASARRSQQSSRIARGPPR